MKSKVNYAFIVGLLAVAMAFVSCKPKESAKKIVTERIQYDVLLKSPGPDYPWWVQNLEGSSRETFIKGIINAAYEGKVKAYDVDHKLLSPAEVKAIENFTDTILGPSPVAPYNDTTIIMEHHLSLDKINRVRFLEEWRMDETTLEMEKKVIGICPVIENYDENGEFRAWQPLFWIYFDPAYPAKFELK